LTIKLSVRVDQGKVRLVRVLTIEDQLRVGRDSGNTLGAVGKVSGDGEPALASNLHADEADVPTLDDFTLSKTEGERLALGVRVEDLSVLQLSDVPHVELASVLGDGTSTGLLVLDGDAVDDFRGGGLLGRLLGVLLAVSRALLDRLCKLDLLLGLGGLGAGLNRLAVVGLQLLLLLL
jgi:hypothetical protein